MSEDNNHKDYIVQGRLMKENIIPWKARPKYEWAQYLDNDLSKGICKQDRCLYYCVDLREILNGERKANNMDVDLKETLVMVADYTNEEKKKLVSSLYSMIWTCIVAFGILVLINVFHLTRESTNWDTTAVFCSAIGLIYAVSCFVRVLQLTGKMDRKSHSKVVVASLILAGGLFVLTIVAVLYGCGIIG